MLLFQMAWNIPEESAKVETGIFSRQFVEVVVSALIAVVIVIAVIIVIVSPFAYPEDALIAFFCGLLVAALYLLASFVFISFLVIGVVIIKELEKRNKILGSIEAPLSPAPVLPESINVDVEPKGQVAETVENTGDMRCGDCVHNLDKDGCKVHGVKPFNEKIRHCGNFDQKRK